MEASFAHDLVSMVAGVVLVLGLVVPILPRVRQVSFDVLRIWFVRIEKIRVSFASPRKRKRVTSRSAGPALPSRPSKRPRARAVRLPVKSGASAKGAKASLAHVVRLAPKSPNGARRQGRPGAKRGT
jgi:hypothetical protein